MVEILSDRLAEVVTLATGAHNPGARMCAMERF